jgi:exoribonuclease R
MQKIYQIKIKNRNYDDWYYTDLLENKTDIDYNPTEYKLFNNDIVLETPTPTNNDPGVTSDSQTIVSNKKTNIKIIDSQVRKNKNIPGILILKDNKTYGRIEKKTKQGDSVQAGQPGKLLYKCIPDDKTLPAFLIPYEFKHSTFSKLYSNLYVTFSYSKWDNKDKHPIGILSNVIGEVNNKNVDVYYEYRLLCKNLNISVQQFNKTLLNNIKTLFDSSTVDINNITNDYILMRYPELDNRTNQEEWNVFTIDSVNTTDYDDAFSIKKIQSNSSSDNYLLSIYISNVALWMEMFGLWNAFSNRISNIYLPDKKITMLPTLLSSNLCSLIENAYRYAFTMDITICVNTYDGTGETDIMIENIEFKNTIINVSNNYSYNQNGLLQNNNYNTLIYITKLLSRKYVCQYDVTDSQNMVAYLMMLMNYYCAKNLKKNNAGILLKNNITNSSAITNMTNRPKSLNNYMTSWYLSKSEYISINTIDNMNNTSNITTHESLQLDAYTHITSPIRRIVDLLNLIEMQELSNIFVFSKEARQFCNKWTSVEQIAYINTNMKSIRKLQNECTLLDMFYNIPEVINKPLDGIIIDIYSKEINKSSTKITYIVYIPEFKITSKITKLIVDQPSSSPSSQSETPTPSETPTQIYKLYSHIKCQLYIFSDEYDIKQKVKLSDICY